MLKRNTDITVGNYKKLHLPLFGIGLPYRGIGKNIILEYDQFLPKKSFFSPDFSTTTIIIKKTVASANFYVSPITTSILDFSIYLAKPS